MSEIKRIAVLCSGGDSPGMNCAIRAVVRTGIGAGLEVFGIQKGYAGLLEGNIRQLEVSSVGNILQHGGTILQTSRCPEFMTEEGRREAANLLKRKKIEALIVIGGDGSFNGAMKLYEEHQIPVVGIPGTIDNDIDGTEYTIGFDTAVQNAVDAVDKIRDTANSHARTFIVEVMGRRSPAIALKVGICTGAENVVLPTTSIDYQKIVNDIDRGIKRGKTSSIIIAAEGEVEGVGHTIQKELKDKFGLQAHVCILGHIQRGGNPTPTDRYIASQMGQMAIEALVSGEKATATVFLNGKVVLAQLKNCLRKKNEFDVSDIELLTALSI
ncbi:MAG: 6-phosphofructokinase [Alphaproteobacteria bacterium]|nr:MAG: 6-phosphofructokinase [Alphaproteobacteria bacterium]